MLHSFPHSERCVRPTKAYWWKTVIQLSRYATMDTTNVLSSYFMTVDMHRFAFLWLVYSRNKFFRMGPKNLFQGEQILGGSKLNVTGQLIMFKCNSISSKVPEAWQSTSSSGHNWDLSEWQCCLWEVQSWKQTRWWWHIWETGWVQSMTLQHISCRFMYVHSVAEFWPCVAILLLLCTDTLTNSPHASFCVWW